MQVYARKEFFERFYDFLQYLERTPPTAEEVEFAAQATFRLPVCTENEMETRLIRPEGACGVSIVLLKLSSAVVGAPG